MSLNVKVKGQGQHGQKRRFLALLAACVWFMFGKTSLASSLRLLPAEPESAGLLGFLPQLIQEEQLLG